MAKKRRKNSTKCPEPFNSLIDLAAGLTMSAIANKMEDKHHYRKRGVPNPYRASALGFSSGKLNKTEDILKLGGFLGAMGSFGDSAEYDYTPSIDYKYQTHTPWEFNNIGFNQNLTNNNKYAWRLNCRDGSRYGIIPENFETREEYNQAIVQAENSAIFVTEKCFSQDKTLTNDNTKIETHAIYKVSLIDSGTNDYFLSNCNNYNSGDIVEVLYNDVKTVGVVLTKEDAISFDSSTEIKNYILKRSKNIRID